MACALAVHIQAQAQPYPAKPIRLLIPTAAGGGPDTIGRAIGQALTDNFGQTVVVDNRPGASGAIALDLGRLAAADGYTLNIFSVSQIIRPLLFRVPYDLERDFAPITQLSAQSYVLMTTPSLPVKSVPELLAHARANPGKLNFASVGQGSQIHLMTELFRAMTKIQVVHVPYKGIAAAYPDLFAGTIHFTFAGIISAQAHVKAQRVRALAVSGPTRMKALPELPTVAEAGVPGFAVTQWYGLLAPAGTPRATVGFLNKEANRALQQPDVAGRIAAEGSEAVGSTPQQLAAQIKAERAKWVKVIKESGIKGEE
ncbi:MAG TPA: tripartite tricarboxylate transporter substrate binding protein [Burkholderiales bacterium]|nr:tripartite tricarboxylate transporter substrate binding protein [Burkholderiales bacterium]